MASLNADMGSAAKKIESRLRARYRRTANTSDGALGRTMRHISSRRAGRAALRAEIDGLRAELDHLRRRHGEQIERLEDLTRELVATAESLRRGLPRGDRGE